VWSATAAAYKQTSDGSEGRGRSWLTGRSPPPRESILGSGDSRAREVGAWTGSAGRSGGVRPVERPVSSGRGAGELEGEAGELEGEADGFRI
jgi:hypothetical protein